MTEYIDKILGPGEENEVRNNLAPPVGAFISEIEMLINLCIYGVTKVYNIELRLEKNSVP